jgi:hypothetical protein
MWQGPFVPLRIATAMVMSAIAIRGTAGILTIPATIVEKIIIISWQKLDQPRLTFALLRISSRTAGISS